jgi:hypothetical protein
VIKKKMEKIRKEQTRKGNRLLPITYYDRENKNIWSSLVGRPTKFRTSEFPVRTLVVLVLSDKPRIACPDDIEAASP